MLHGLAFYREWGGDGDVVWSIISFQSLKGEHFKGYPTKYVSSNSLSPTYLLGTLFVPHSLFAKVRVAQLVLAVLWSASSSEPP